MSRKDILTELCKFCGIAVPERDLFRTVFDKNIPIAELDKFVCRAHTTKLADYDTTEDELYAQLYEMHILDWGGLYQNGLEKTIVNNYVKKIVDYDCLEEKINDQLHESMSGYVKSSWYNHWTTILIEDMFGRHERVIPAIGKVKNVDFFWDDIPLDLKITYFPIGYMTKKRNEIGLSSELAMMQRFAKDNKIPYDGSTRNRNAAKELFSMISESHAAEARSFITKLRNIRTSILSDTIANPKSLATWLYAKQGERRFDRVYRFYLVLVDMDNFEDSWKMKRNRDLIPQKIAEFLSNDPQEKIMDIQFEWKNEMLDTKCVVLFIVRELNRYQ